MGWKPAQAWTSGQPVEGYRHFRLVLQGGKGKDRWVELEAVLNSAMRRRVPWQQLCDREQWSSGWQQLPAEEDGSDKSTPEGHPASPQDNAHGSGEGSAVNSIEDQSPRS